MPNVDWSRNPVSEEVQSYHRNWPKVEPSRRARRRRVLDVQPLEDRQLLEADLEPFRPPEGWPGGAFVGDINGDGQIDLHDFTVLKSLFGATNGFHAADLNGDNVVDIKDFRLLKSVFGRAPEDHSNPLRCEVWDPLSCVEDVPAQFALPSFADPFAGESYTVRHQYVDGTLRWTFEEYADGSRRSEYWHDIGLKRVYYPSGRMLSESLRFGAITEYYLDEPSHPASTTDRGRVVWRVQSDGREWRYSYWGDGPRVRQAAFLAQGQLESLTVFFESGKLLWRVYRDTATGSRRLESYYADGRPKLLYNDATGEFSTYLDETFATDSLGNSFGRVVAQGSAQQWKLYAYHGSTNVPETIVTWAGRDVQLTEKFFADGKMRYRTLPPHLRSTEGVQRDAQGMVIRRASDERLNFTYLPGEWQLRASTDLDSLWMTAFRIRLRDGGTLAEAFNASVGHFAELAANFQTNNPDIDVGSYHSFLYVKQQTAIKQLGFYPRDSFEWESIPHSYLTGETSKDPVSGAPIAFLDLGRPEVRNYLVEELVNLGLGNSDRPKLDAFFLDNVGMHVQWPEKLTVLKEVKRRLNEGGVYLDLNIGGYGFMDHSLPTVANPAADLAAAANGINIESPWRLKDRTVAYTEQIIRNMRAVLSQGLSLGIINSHFDYRKTNNVTTVPRSITSIQEVERDFGNGKLQKALLVTLERAHRIFPSGGYPTNSIILQDLPEAYAAWQGTNYTPYPVPGHDNQVLLYVKNGDVPQAGSTFGTRFAGSATLFNAGELRRLYAAFAMMVRNPGDKIAVDMVMQVEQPGDGDPVHPDNWTTWPAQFGRPLGDYVIEEPRMDPTVPAAKQSPVIKLSRQFEFGKLVIYPQEGWVETIFTPTAGRAALSTPSGVTFPEIAPGAAVVGVAALTDAALTMDSGWAAVAASVPSAGPPWFQEGAHPVVRSNADPKPATRSPLARSGEQLGAPAVAVWRGLLAMDGSWDAGTQLREAWDDSTISDLFASWLAEE